MSSNCNAGCNQCQVFYDVLPFKRRYEPCSPDHVRQKDKRQDSCNHMNKEKRYNNALCALDKEEQADKAFEQRKGNEECMKGDKGNGLLVQGED